MEELLIAGILFLALLLLITIGLLLYYIGLFHSVDVGAGTPPIQKAVVAYKFAQGPYKKSGDLFCEITRCAPDCRAIGMYYDDPKKIPAKKLRYAVGAILAEGNVKVEPEFQAQLESEGFKIIQLPAVTNCVKTTFPYINTLSILVAVMRVYPCITSYVKERNLCAYPMVEIYDTDIIHFMAPLAKQDEFFVPEAKQCVPDEYNEGDDTYMDSADGTPSSFDGSFESSPSPSESTFSHGSHQAMESTVNESDNDAGDDSTTDIQDQEVTSSVDVNVTESETELMRDSKGESDSLVPDIQDNLSLQDSGVYSGRTSAVPNDSSVSAEAVPGTVSEENGNDSSSSFEEIHVDDEGLKQLKQ